MMLKRRKVLGLQKIKLNDLSSILIVLIAVLLFTLTLFLSLNGHGLDLNSAVVASVNTTPVSEDGQGFFSPRENFWDSISVNEVSHGKLQAELSPNKVVPGDIMRISIYDNNISYVNASAQIFHENGSDIVRLNKSKTDNSWSFYWQVHDAVEKGEYQVLVTAFDVQGERYSKTLEWFDPPKQCTLDGSASSSGVSCAAGTCFKNEDTTDATIDSCVDSTITTYMSVHDIYLDASGLNPGDTLNVDCETWCYSSSTRVAIAYNNGTGWRQIQSGSCVIAGTGASTCTGTSRLYNYSASITVDNIIGEHTVRCMEQWSTLFTSTQTCITANYGDNDDINFTVSAAAANNLPNVTSIYLNATDFPDNTTNANLTLNLTVSDSDGDPVKNITNWYVNGTSWTLLNMPFEKINGTTTDNAWDYSGYGNSGTVTGATWSSTSGFDGKGAYSFDGTDYIAFNPVNFGNNFTIELWANPSDLPNQILTLVANSPSGSNTDGFRFEINTYKTGDGKIIFETGNGAAGSVASTNTGVTSFGQWNHIAVVVKRAEGKATIYLNGADVTVADSTQTDFMIDSDFDIGQMENNLYRYYGVLDEVHIYNRSLSGEQILALYNNRTDFIVNNETRVDDIWQACVTPNDGTEDGNQTCSNNLTINWAAEPVTCGTITSNTSLTNNITVTQGTCFIINGSSHVFLDGAGYSLIGTPEANGTAIFINNSNYIEIKNFFGIDNFSRGVSAENLTYSNITNNTFSTINTTAGFAGIAFTLNSNNNLIRDNVITAENNSKGIYFVENNLNNIISNNNITAEALFSVNILLDDYYNNNTNISHNLITISTGPNALTIQSPYTYIYNNTLISNGVSSLISLENGGGYNTIDKNNFTLNVGGNDYVAEATQGILVQTSNNNITRNNFTTSAHFSQGLTIFNSMLNLVENNHFLISGDDSYGIGIIDSSANNTVNANNITVSGTGASHAFYEEFVGFAGALDWNLLQNNNFSSLLNYSIYDNEPSNTSLIFNNSYGFINWTKANLTTNVSLVIGDTILLQNNSVGLLSNVLNFELNSSAYIELKGLTWSSTPQLLLDGTRCDDTNLCNISYDVEAGILSANVSYIGNFSTGASAMSCGSISENTTLTNNITSTGTCVTFGASNLELDCAGYQIEYGTGTNGYGVFITQLDNSFVKNCLIKKGGGGLDKNYGIYLNDTLNTNITNNTVITNGTSANYALYMLNANNTLVSRNNFSADGSSYTNIASSSLYSKDNIFEYNHFNSNGQSTSNIGVYITLSTNFSIKHDTITTNGTDSDIGIYLSLAAADVINIINNTITTNGTTSGNTGISTNGNEGNIINNTIRTGGTSSNYGIGISGDNNIIENNVVVAGGTEGNNYAFHISTTSNDNNLINNNLTSVNNISIYDISTAANYLVYNNSFGEVRWTNTSAGGFLNNLSTILNNDQGFGIGKNLFIYNGTVNLNTSAFLSPMINSSANLTLEGLSFTDPVLLKDSFRCDDTPDCLIVSYSDNRLIANVSYLGNFTAREKITSPVLIYPVSGSTTTNRTLAFVWNNSLDQYSSNLNYNLTIDTATDFSSPIFSWTNITNISDVNITFEFPEVLDVDSTYFWKVTANDSTGYGGNSSVFNFTLQSYLAISIINDSVDFGHQAPGAIVDTSNNTYQPFYTENVGNIEFNVTLNASQYFNAVPFPSNYYQFKMREKEAGAFNTGLSQLVYTNMTPVLGATPHLVSLNWSDQYDDFYTDILVNVPTNESPGAKSSLVTFNIEG